jgi:hypothetical protein
MFLVTNVTEFVTQQGYIFTTSDGRRHGPVEAQAYDNQQIADAIGVKPKQVLQAHLRNLQRPVAVSEIQEILSTTIKRDNPTKSLLFLTQLLTYTNCEQQNIAMQADSSTGKSYIPLEIAAFFPQDDVKVIASASPTAFFHDSGTWDEERKAIIVNLEKKILIFLDQPHYMLMEKLRPLLSHDRQELHYKITDRNQKKGLRTKNVFLRGYPTIIFCSAKLNLDEQEQTRVFLVSPEVEEEKIMESIYLLAEKLGNRTSFQAMLAADARRSWLQARVEAIKAAHIYEVLIDDSESVCKRFLNEHTHLIPRHQRDFPRLIALIKGHALLNYSNRELINDHTIKANQEDVNAGFNLYNRVAKPNEIGLSPHVYDIYQKVIKPHLDPTIGLTRRSIQHEYFQYYHRALNDERLRREILPALEAAGLILQDHDPHDKRKRVVYPTDPPPISQDTAAHMSLENNRGDICRVNPTGPLIEHLFQKEGLP